MAKSCGDNTVIASLQLNAPEGSLLNCLGIQPIFHKDGFIERSSLCSVYHNESQISIIAVRRYNNCQLSIINCQLSINQYSILVMRT